MKSPSYRKAPTKSRAVYLLKDGEAIFYVGLTSQDPKARLADHIADAKSGTDRPISDYIRRMLAAGRTVSVITCCLPATPRDELSFIEGFLEDGHPLQNVIGRPDYWRTRCLLAEAEVERLTEEIRHLKEGLDTW